MQQHYIRITVFNLININETKPSSTNAFLAHLFALESQKGSRNEERTLYFLFWYSSEVWTCLLTLSIRTTPLGGFPDCFGFSHFLATFSSFQKKRARPLD